MIPVRRTIAPLAALLLLTSCAGGEYEDDKAQIDPFADETSAIDNDTMCEPVLEDEANNNGLMMDMAFKGGDDSMSDEAIDEWVVETCGDVPKASPEPAPTVTVTAEPDAMDDSSNDPATDM